jgi:hypothetical protein
MLSHVCILKATILGNLKNDTYFLQFCSFLQIPEKNSVYDRYCDSSYCHRYNEAHLVNIPRTLSAHGSPEMRVQVVEIFLLKIFCDFVSSDSKHLFIFYRTQHHTLNVLLSAHSCDHFRLSLAALLRSNHRASGQTRKLRTRTKTWQQSQISLLSLLYRIHHSNALPPLLPCIHLFPFINVLSCHVGPCPFKTANLAED